jgi:hypothetical protein
VCGASFWLRFASGARGKQSSDEKTAIESKNIKSRQMSAAG